MPDPTPGNCSHTCWSADGYVYLANDSDNSIVQRFDSRQDIETFLASIIAEAEATFPAPLVLTNSGYPAELAPHPFVG